MTIQLLRIPTKHNTVEDVLGMATQLDLSNVLLLSEKEDGSLIYLGTDMTLANTNWLLDKMKTLLLVPDAFERKGP